MLDVNDKQAFETMIKAMKMDSEVKIDTGEVEKLYKRFEVLRAEIQNGNDNISLKKELRLVILQLINMKRIPKAVGYNVLYELSL
jgi:hypothetical protein